MWKLAVRSLSEHKSRLAMTAISIALGVAFVTGTFVFTDSIQARFDTLFTDVYAGVDATVRPEAPDFGVSTETLAAELGDTLADVDGVGEIAGAVGGFAQPIDADGNPIGGQGPPSLGYSWVENEALNILRIEEGNGRGPVSAGEVVVDVGTASANGFEIGDTIDVAFLTGPIEQFELVGVANFGTEDNLAGATLTAFELNEARRVMGLDGFNQFDILGDGSISDEQLLENLAAALPVGAEVVSGDDQTQEQLSAVTDGLGFITTGLLAFAGVAVFVGAFIIQNTFRITVAQRTKELALLRAIGASARQVTRIVALEALAISLIASAAGVGLGIGLAQALKSLMEAIGFGLPDGPLTVQWATVAIAMSVGVGVTMISSLLPARKAARIAPVEAMRAGDARVSAKSLRRRGLAGGATAFLGAALLGLGLSEVVSNGITLVGAGALLVFVGVSILAPLMAKPVAAFVGWPLPRLFGVPGQLARDNTRRQPRRTAATASALMVGVALVGFVAVFSSSIQASIDATFREAYQADVSVQSVNPTGAVGGAFLEEASQLDEFDVLSGVTLTQVKIADQLEQIAAVDHQTIGSVYTMGAEPSTDLLANGIFVREDTLEEDGYLVGDMIAVTFAESGEQLLEITGTFTDTSLAPFMVSNETLISKGGEVSPFLVLAAISPGADRDAATLALSELAETYGTLQVQTLSEVIANAEAQVDQLLGLFQGLLGLAIIIAVLGITNTLALSVVERKREVGLLRAVGMNRRQVRRMIRWEAVIISVFGALLGVALGTALGWATIVALAEDGLGEFVIPFANLSAYVGLAAVAGVVAAIGPARTASRLNILDAIAYE